MHIASVGIDLGKTTFHLVALGEHSKVVFRRKFSESGECLQFVVAQVSTNIKTHADVLEAGQLGSPDRKHADQQRQSSFRIPDVKRHNLYD